MRVTANSFPNSLTDQLTQLSGRLNRLQNQAATGQRVKLPSDDPTAMRRVLDMQAEGKTLQQYQRNIARHQELAQASYAPVKALKQISDRAGEIAVLADSMKSPEQMEVMAKEVSELIKQAVQLANTRNRGDYIFAGTRSQTQPFEITSNADGHVTSVTFQGNESLPESEIAQNVTLTGQHLGSNTSGTGPRGLITDTRSGADFFNHLISLQNNLRAHDAQAVTSTDLPNLIKDEENLIIHMGNNGAIQARLSTTQEMTKQRDLSLENLVSREVDADLAQTLVRLSQTQNAYTAALQSASKILNQSLLDYIR